MKRTKCVLLAGGLALTLAWIPIRGDTPLGTAFTYQGQLKNNNAPASGTFDLQFRLWNHATDTSAGALVAGPICVDGVVPNAGLFTVQLDFGASPFAGSARWLEISVRADSIAGNCSAGVYTTLSPRQPLTATPCSTFSLNSPGSGLWTGTAAAIMNTNSSFVGINRNTAVNSSEAFGIQSPAAGTNYGGMYIRTNSTTAKPYYGYSTGAQSAWTYLDGTTGDWRINNDGDRLIVTDTGDVGIGTDPSARLHVVSAPSNGDTLLVSNTGTGRAGQFYVPGNSSAEALYAVTYGTYRAALFEAHTSNTTPTVHMYKNQGPVLRLVNGFNGGTAADDASLAIIGGSDTSAAGGGFIVCGSVASSNISIDNNEIMARNNGAVARLALNAEGGDVTVAQSGPGRLGVGVTSPSAHVHVFANDTTALGQFTQLGTGNGVSISITNSSNLSPALSVNTLNGDIPALDASTASIGASHLPAGVKLAVGGKVLCEELEVQLQADWPDYVFGDDYCLMPLEHVEAFVKEHRHLPNVPSAAEIKGDGINVGQMQTTLTRTVEELTLHMIEMNKQLDGVRRENAELRAKLDSLVSQSR